MTKVATLLGRTLLVAAMGLPLACGGADDRPPPMDIGDDVVQDDVPPVDDPAVAEDVIEPGAACEDAVARECKIKLPAHNGVASCFVGVQLCLDGAWTDCADPSEYDDTFFDGLEAADPVGM